MKLYSIFLFCLSIMLTVSVESFGSDTLTEFSFGIPVQIHDELGTDIGDQFRYSNIATGLDAIVTITGTNITTEANVNIVHEGTDDLRTRLSETPGVEEIAWLTYNFRIVDAGTTNTISIPIAHSEVLFSDLDGINDRPGLSDFAGIQSSDFNTVSLDVTSKLLVKSDIINGYHVGIFDDGQYGIVNEGQANADQSFYMIQFDLYNFTEFNVVNGYLTFDTDTEDIGGFDYSRHVEMDMNGDYDLVTPVSKDLPIELLAFTAKKTGSNVELKWETAQEINNSHFEVEYALDGVSFRSFAHVLGQGTTNNVSEYQTTHLNLNEITNANIYYRLKQVDFDGAFEYSNIIAVSFKNGKVDEISVYPNPVNLGRKVFITFPRKESTDNYIISVYNSFGAKVINHEYDGSSYISIPNSLSEGYYVLTVMDNNQNQLLKERIILLE